MLDPETFLFLLLLHSRSRLCLPDGNIVFVRPFRYVSVLPLPSAPVGGPSPRKGVSCTYSTCDYLPFLDRVSETLSGDLNTHNRVVDLFLSVHGPTRCLLTRIYLPGCVGRRGRGVDGRVRSG